MVLAPLFSYQHTSEANEGPVSNVTLWYCYVSQGDLALVIVVYYTNILDRGTIAAVDIHILLLLPNALAR